MSTRHSETRPTSTDAPVNSTNLLLCWHPAPPLGVLLLRLVVAAALGTRLLDPMMQEMLSLAAARLLELVQLVEDGHRQPDQLTASESLFGLLRQQILRSGGAGEAVLSHSDSRTS
jgi:hypothetical protein